MIYNDYAPLFNKKMKEQKRIEKMYRTIGVVVYSIGYMLVTALGFIALSVIAIALQ